MSYTKITGTMINAESFINLLRTNIALVGWTEVFYGDNIISSVNLGKKVIFSKSDLYLYIAASDDNDPVTDRETFTTNQISCLKFCLSTTLNTSNNWFSNNVNGTSPNLPSGIEIKQDKPFSFYYNSNNFIIISNFATGLYSSMFVGNIAEDTFFANGSFSENSLVSGNGRISQDPVFRLQGNYSMPTFFQSGVNTSYGLVFNNHFKSNYAFYNDSACYRTDQSFPNQKAGHINRADSILYDVSMLFDIQFYDTDPNNGLRPYSYIEDVYIVNFNLLTAEQNVPLGLESYDVFPFLKKEAPQRYDNNETWGQGFAIKVSG